MCRKTNVFFRTCYTRQISKGFQAGDMPARKREIKKSLKMLLIISSLHLPVSGDKWSRCIQEVIYMQVLVCFCFTRRKSWVSNMYAIADPYISTVAGLSDTGDFCVHKYAMPSPINWSTYVCSHTYLTERIHLWKDQTTLTR